MGLFGCDHNWQSGSSSEESSGVMHYCTKCRKNEFCDFVFQNVVERTDPDCRSITIRSDRCECPVCGNINHINHRTV